MTSFQPSRREGGFTLLELLLVIGVAALLLIGGIATYRLVSEGNRATEATRLLLTLRSEAGTMAQQNGGTYTGITYDSSGAADDAANGKTNLFVASGILGNFQKNPFNGGIVITPTDPATGKTIDITFDGVSKASCIKMFTAIVNPNEIVKLHTAADYTPTDLVATNATVACGADTNDMTWTLN